MCISGFVVQLVIAVRKAEISGSQLLYDGFTFSVTLNWPSAFCHLIVSGL